ncbi:MAG TPA: HAD-IIB family hydrolase [Candidatus Acidoferrales bacterium]|nr:HAD-IIB family hydrolase [Candidatus Acidoferrales bacterium]
MAAHEAQATGTGGRGRSLSPPLAVLRARHLVFTDLDGTLLDHHTYSWAAAKEALAEIDRRRVPLILVTSKTRAELELLRRRMGHTHPFITENGGGIFIPHGYFNLHIEGAHRIAHYHCLSLSRPYAEMVAALEEIASAAGVGVVGFHQMSAREIAQNTGLALREAKLAKQRDFDEPFFFVGGEKQAETKFTREAHRRGMEVVRGGRFWHLVAGSDKGRAARLLAGLYQKAWHGRLRTVGLGDSPNDLSLLAAVDQAVLLPRPDGSFAEEVVRQLPHVGRGSAPGPSGWNQAVLRILAAGE